MIGTHPILLLPRNPGLASRVAQHLEIEREIRGLSDDELLDWLSDSDLLDCGHAAIPVRGDHRKVFVKLLPLTALEIQPQHQHSTANLFHLPLYYQYRLGGCGFGAWRELEIHRMANQWVLSGQCSHFPLLHDWRILPIVNRGPDDKRSMKPWGSDPAIQRRVSSIAESTSSAVLFLEYFPRTLSEWFRDQRLGLRDRTSAVLKTEAALLDIVAFMNGKGVLHMDAHFENILTDGSQFFLSDHGLAISRTFLLDAAELMFFERHENFDRCTAITSYVHALVTRYDSKEDWRQTLRDLNEGIHSGIEDVPAAVRSYLLHRGPLALAMGDFHRRLMADLATEYPASSLQTLLGATPVREAGP